jgi:hypothetical protein
MGMYASKVVEQAKAWIGCKESNSTHKAIIDVYNSHKPLARGYAVKYTDEWCATFVSAVAIKLGYTSIIPTECSCSKMIALLKSLGSWDENDARVPNPGELIFYHWNDNGVGDNTSNPNHIGIVEKVSGNTITVIEGNYSEEVKRRTIAVNGKYIRGYGVPKYDVEAAAKKSVSELAQEVLDGKWGNGDDRKKRLATAGYNYSEVQAKVNEILNASKPKITVGSTVKLDKGAKTYNGKSLASFVYSRNHKVKEISGDRAVITYLGITVAAVKVKDLTLV